MNTAADFLPRLESDPNEKYILNISEEIPTQPIEINSESTGIAWKDQVCFHTDDVELPPEEQLWQWKQQKSNTVDTEPPVRTVSLSHI